MKNRVTSPTNNIINCSTVRRGASHFLFAWLIQGCIRYLQISSIAHGGDPLPVEKSVNIRSILRYTGKIPNVSYFLCFKICFPMDNHCKRLNAFSDLLESTRTFWSLLRVLWMDLIYFESTSNIFRGFFSRPSFSDVQKFAVP